MSQASEFLLEIGAYDGAGVRTLRVSSCGYVTAPTDTPANTVYPNHVTDPGHFARSLFEEGRTMGMARADHGSIELSNAEGRLDAWLNYGFDGRPVVVKRISGPRADYSTAETILRGTVEGLDGSAALTTLRLRLYDRRLELERALQANRYTGATTSGGLAGNLVNGTADMKDQPKPLVFGRALVVKPILVNPFDLIYQVNDSAVAAIAVYEGGVTLTNKGDYASVAALQAAVLRPGQYATCLALGYFRIGFTPFYGITADVTEGVSLAQRSAGAVVLRMLARLGLTGSDNINTASFAVLQAAAPQEVGIYITDERSALEAISAVLQSIGGYLVPNAVGAFEAGRMAAPGTPTWLVDESIILSDDLTLLCNPDTDRNLPAWRVVVRHTRIWDVQDAERVGQFLSDTRKAYLATEYREAKADNPAVLVRHPLAPELTVETLLVNAADATAAATRWLSLYGVRRDVIVIPVARENAGAMVLGSTGTVRFGRYGYDQGKPMVVIGRREDPANETVDLTVWG
ncbi:hypothetical protein [Devosia sp. 1635]|uniref:hypothetical protein n=1 Tax=Devosia sp. 1635 TaxID=2726066 RepID=UPI001565C97F|nr:hypothetical protein [Devosia sp. 1635]